MPKARSRPIYQNFLMRLEYLEAPGWVQFVVVQALACSCGGMQAKSPNQKAVLRKKEGVDFEVHALQFDSH